MKTIEKLRSLSGFETWERNETVEEIEDLLYYRADVKVVDESFEDGGRWSNYESKVYEVIEGTEIAYFQITEEVPATEMQDGGDFMFSFQEVEPYQVIETKYRGV